MLLIMQHQVTMRIRRHDATPVVTALPDAFTRSVQSWDPED
jgi:hypothetical protein